MRFPGQVFRHVVFTAAAMRIVLNMIYEKLCCFSARKVSFAHAHTPAVSYIETIFTMGRFHPV